MNSTAKLSKREKEVAEVLAFTKSAHDAAEKLCIAPGTLSAHSFRIYEKLEINSKAELVIWWFLKNFKIDENKIPHFIIVLFMNAAILCPGEKIANRRVRKDSDVYITWNFNTTR